jgi:putative transposase
VNAFLNRPIEGEWRYLWIDATYLKEREGGQIVSTAVIVAVGVNTLGKREVLGVASGPSEAESFWTRFLRSLADRGLRGIKLVISDDHKGLRSAAGKVFNATQQRCRLHWMRNALAHVGAKQRPAVVAMLKTIFAQESADAAHEQWHHVADALREQYEKLAVMMDGSREEVLAYMGVPQGALGADFVHQPARTRQQGDQAQGRCHRHLPRHPCGHPPRRSAHARAER